MSTVNKEQLLAAVNEMRANADKLAELCRIAEIYSREIPDSEAGQMLKRHMPKIEALSGQLAFDVRSLTAEQIAAADRAQKNVTTLNS